MGDMKFLLVRVWQDACAVPRRGPCRRRRSWPGVAARIDDRRANGWGTWARLGLALVLGGAVLGGSLSACGSGGSDSDPPSAPAGSLAIEQLATPLAFAAITRRSGEDGQPLNISGTITLGSDSDGIDPARERVVVALGAELTRLEPGSLSCDASGPCAFADDRQPLVRAVQLHRQSATTWNYRIAGAARPADAATLMLRIGNDWGGVDLASGNAILAQQTMREGAHAAQATVGAAGGVVQTTDADGVRIVLDIPAGALSADTVVTVTPLGRTPLVNGSGLLHAGVELEPSGLAFAAPPTLTLDFSATGQAVAEGQSVFLVTSPLSTFPQATIVNGATRTITATIDHFSTYAAGIGNINFVDLAGWSDPILRQQREMTLSDLKSMAEMIEMQNRIGCAQHCIDVQELAAKARQALATLVGEACPADIADPSDLALRRWLGIAAVAQRLDVQMPAVENCARQVLRTMIEKAASAGVVNPAVDIHVQRLIELLAYAQQLGYADAEALARVKLELVMERIIDFVGLPLPLAPTYPDLDRLLSYHLKTQQLAFPPLEIKALSYIAQGVRALMQIGVDQCAADATRAQGHLALGKALTYALAANTDAADAALKGDLSTAINACRPPLKAFMLGPVPTPGTNDSFHPTTVQMGCAQPASEGVDCGFQWVKLDADAAAPASIQSAAVGLELRRLSTHVIALDGSFSAPRGISAQIAIGFTFPGPGTLEVVQNPGWQSSPATPCLHPMDLGAVRAVRGNWDEIHGFTISTGEPLCANGVDHVNRPYPFGNVVGSGRIATFRFIPQ